MNNLVKSSRKAGQKSDSRVASLAKKLGSAAVAAVVCTLALEAAFRLAGYKAIYDVYSKPDLFWRHDPLLGWSHQPGASGVYVGPRPFPVEFRGHVRINSLGLRGPEVTPVPPGGFRVLVLGDSVVAGFEVDDEKTFEALLQHRLSTRLGVPVQVINAGVRGYGTDQSYLYYREQGWKLHPDVVVFVNSDNDPEDDTTLHRACRPFGKPAFSLQPDGALKLVGMPVPDYPLCSAYRLDDSFQPRRIDGLRARTLCWLQTNLSDHSALFTFVTMRLRQNPRLIYRLFKLTTPAGQATKDRPAYRLTSALIRELARTVRQNGAQFLLVIEKPDLDVLDHDAFARDGIDIFDRDKMEINGSYEGLSWKNDSHFNERGHERFAEVLEPALVDELAKAAAHRAQASPGAVDSAANPLPASAAPNR